MASPNQFENTSDEELERILRQGEQAATSGYVRMYETAKAELEYRRNKQTFEHQKRVLNLQEKLYSTAQSRLDRIIKLLDKPLWLAFFASVWGFIIGVAINVFTAFFCSWIHCPK